MVIICHCGQDAADAWCNARGNKRHFPVTDQEELKRQVGNKKLLSAVIKFYYSNLIVLSFLQSHDIICYVSPACL